jgi:hypothetical protein
VTRMVMLLTQSQIPELIMDNISDESESDWVTATEEWVYEECEVESMLKKDCALWHRCYTECSRAQVPHSIIYPVSLKTKMSHSYNRSIHSDNKVRQHVLVLKCHTTWFTHCPWW